MSAERGGKAGVFKDVKRSRMGNPPDDRKRADRAAKPAEVKCNAATLAR